MQLTKFARGGCLPAGLATQLLVLGGSGRAAAAESSASLEEIVMTATSRAERLEDVPISVTAFTQEKIDQQRLRSIDDLMRLTPGVTFQRNGTSRNYNDEGSDVNILRIDSTAGTSTTGVYFNDTLIQSRHIGLGSVRGVRPRTIGLTATYRY
jgi:iron complex outermembrane receptor protein